MKILWMPLLAALVLLGACTSGQQKVQSIDYASVVNPFHTEHIQILEAWIWVEQT